MRKVVVFLLVFTVFGTNFTLLADDDEKLKLAVMEFEDLSRKLPKEMLSGATEYIRGAFVASNKYIVIAKERQEKAMIKEMKKESYKVCNDKNCQIPLGQALSADTILRTTINFFGGTYTITSELIDLEKEATVSGAKATFNGSEKSLSIALDDIVAQILGKKSQQSLFQEGKFGGRHESWDIGGGKETIVKFESDPSGAVVIADGKILCQSTPCSKMLAQGKHEIEMQKENYVPKLQKQEIKDGENVKFILDPDFSYLNVTGNYAVELRLDGQNIGRIPIEERIISAGNHKIEHTDPCFYDSGETFTTRRGEKKNINLDLENRESAIKVYAQDEKGNDVAAEVFVDEKQIGKTPDLFKIPLCSRKLLVKNGDFVYAEELRLKEKELQTIQAVLKPIKKQPEGLQWSDKVSKQMNWNDAVAYCRNLSEDGQNDWRMPNIDELRTLIINHHGTETGGSCKISAKNGNHDPNENNDNCQGLEDNNYNKFGDEGQFWSSSESHTHKFKMTFGNAPDTSYFFWTVNFNNGSISYKESTMSRLNNRCVRGEYNKAEEKKLREEKVKRERDNIKKRQSATGLRWSDRAPEKMKWEDGIEYCRNLNEGGFTDWRLPDIDELRTLIKDCPKTESGGECKVSVKKQCLSNDCRSDSCTCKFKHNIKDNNYSKLGDSYRLWSSSSLPADTTYFWSVHFESAAIFYDHKNSEHIVRCVR